MLQLEQLNIGGMSKTGTELLENLNKAVMGAELGKVSADLQALLADFRSALDQANISTLSEDARKLIAGLEKSNSELRGVLKNLGFRNENKRSEG